MFIGLIVNKKEPLVTAALSMNAGKTHGLPANEG
jgi:hypothetical protein